ncbi:MAG TPA: c-type cytochrome, partial [Polyangiaceae bacterium]|nr:c-type cytochrome [Polyangiaceae bacterium]
MKDENLGYIALLVIFLGIGSLLGFKMGWFSSDEPAAAPPAGPIDPLVVDLEALDMDKIALGRRLFHDGILSGDGTVTCATCHDLSSPQASGAEARRTSIGVEGAIGPINSPTVLNASRHIAQFWDGRAADLQEQAGGPIENPLEMRSDFATVIGRLEADDYYAEAFADVFDGATPSRENITDAIATYVASLDTPAPFDAFLQGDHEAITVQAQRGYETFQEVGCGGCHNGVDVGGDSFQKMGLVQDYFAERGGDLTAADLGRFNVTGEESDRHKFRVPTLRNVERTAPYFHDGAAATLPEAIRTMARVQLGRDLTPAQTADIEAFLQSLSGDLPAHALLTDEERPPARAYELPLSYDLRVERSKEGEADRVKLFGRVKDQETYDRVLAMASERFETGVDATGLSIDPAAGPLPESALVCYGDALDALEPLSLGKADFKLTADGVDFSFMGEGTDEAMIIAREKLSSLPDGIRWSTPMVLVDFEQTEACDNALHNLQAQTRIEFRTASAELDPRSDILLRRIAGTLSGCPDTIRLRIDGHTDAQGEESNNLRLSRRRAASVRDRLIGLHVPPSRLLSHGYGEARPIADNGTAEGRQRNRRIALTLDRVGALNYTP